MRKKKVKVEKTVSNSGTVKKVKINIKLLIPVILGFIILIVGGIFLRSFLNKQALKTLKKNYGEYVVVTRNTKLYDKNKKVIGTISKDISLQLEKVEKLTLKNKILKIVNTDYAISYKDIKKVNKKEEEVQESYYLPLGVHIKTNKKIELVNSDKQKIILNKGIDTDILSKDKDHYSIDIQGMEFTFKKDKSMKETTSKKEIDGIAKSVSAIYYEKIDNGCEDDVCLKLESVKAHIKKLQKEGYYFITKNDFISFVLGYRNLKEKAVVLLTGEENDNTKNIYDELKVKVEKIQDSDGIKMVTTNKAATKEDNKDQVNQYQAKRYTLIDEYSSMASGIEVPDVGRKNDPNMSVPVLNYHFFYDASKGESCDETICMEVSDFREELQWLKDNGYKTLTIHEFADWMDGTIEIPNNSVLLTVDDGAMGTSTINGNILMPTLEEYQMHATLFLISGWWDISNYQSPYLDVQSHTHWHHEEASCSDGRGSFVCSSYEEDKADLQDSIAAIGDTTSFCFPFYSYDNESLRAISELGFRYAFVGGNKNARRSDDHLLVPRYPLFSYTSLNQFINMVQ